MKIRTYNIYKEMKNTTSFWWLMTPDIRKYWGGDLVYIGVRAFGIILDFRGINSMQDLADALARPKTWYIIRKLNKYK